MKKYLIKNLDCANCAQKLQKHLENLEEVKYVSINFATSTIEIETENLEKIKKEIKKQENDVYLQEISANQNQNIKLESIYLIFLSFLFISGLIFKIELFLICVYILAAFPIFKKSFFNMKNLKFFDENFLMSIVSIGALLINALPEAACVMLLFKVGNFFENRSLNKSRNSIKSLLELKPTYANIKKDNDLIKTDPKLVKKDDIIIVNPGEKIPLDGIVIDGQSLVNSSNLTGESTPINIQKKDSVLSGMLNINGVLQIKVTKTFDKSYISKIINAIENSNVNKSQTESFMTTFSKYYTPFVVLLAIFIAIIPPIFFHAVFYHWFYKALVLLVISCPCAFVISIPLGYFAGVGIASKKGILIKGSNFIDKLSKVKTIAFDKTGTITKGNFAVSEIKISKECNLSKNELLKFAAIAEFHSNHPIGNSIKTRYKEIEKLKILSNTHYEEFPGLGVKTKYSDQEIIVGNLNFLKKNKIKLNLKEPDIEIADTIIYIAIDKKYSGYIKISDQLKKDSKLAISKLIKKKIDLVMLTGDNEIVSRKIAKMLKIKKYYTKLLPIEKGEIVKKIKKRPIAFVGDGVNDVLALKHADIGISMGNLGSDVAIETSDIVLLNDSLIKVNEAIDISKNCKKIIWQNIILAFIVKGIFIIFGFCGLATIWEAVFADVGVTCLVIFNTLRIFRL